MLDILCTGVMVPLVTTVDLSLLLQEEGDPDLCSLTISNWIFPATIFPIGFISILYKYT